VEDVAVLVDALDFTSIHPWTQNNPLRPIQHLRLFNAQSYKAPPASSSHDCCKANLTSRSHACRLQDGVAKAFGDQGVKAGPASYMAFQGPSLPSNAEAAIAHKIGCPLVGTASLYGAAIVDGADYLYVVTAPHPRTHACTCIQWARVCVSLQWHQRAWSGAACRAQQGHSYVFWGMDSVRHTGDRS
jgi:hypothetical protein